LENKKNIQKEAPGIKKEKNFKERTKEKILKDKIVLDKLFNN